MFLGVPTPEMSLLTGNWLQTWAFVNIPILLENILSVSAVKIIYVLPLLKREYLCRYKSVLLVLYIHGIVGQHTNIFLISRDG